MIIYKQIPCPCQPGCTAPKSQFDGYNCDICKQEFGDSFESSINRRKNTHNPWGGGYGEKIEVDICPDCFDKHILGLLESLGVEVKWEEYNY